MKQAIIVLDLTTGGKGEGALRYSLRAMLPEVLPQRSNSKPAGNTVEPTQLGSGRSFRNMVGQLNSKGLSISGAYQRPDGKVVFLTGKTLDAEAELLFIRLTRSTGWSVVRYNNEDGTVVFAAKAPCVLSDQVKSKDDETRGQLVERDWTNHTFAI